MSEPRAVKRSEVTRREVLRRGAVVGGVLWTAPIIQSVSSPVYAGSGPEILSCCQCREAPSFPSKIGELSCSDCRAYCTGHGGVKSFSRGTGCASRDNLCIPTDSCPKEPCAWQATGPIRLKPIKP